MNTSITSSVTDGQKKQIKRLVEDAVDRVFTDNILNRDRAQKLIKNGDELQTRVIAVIRELSVPNQFANEEVASNFDYPPGYKFKDTTEVGEQQKDFDILVVPCQFGLLHRGTFSSPGT